MQLGEMVTATQSLSDEQIELFAEEIGATIRLVNPGEEQEVELQKVLGVDELLDDSDDENAVTRAPIITALGHDDHGTTKLPATIRDPSAAPGRPGAPKHAIAPHPPSHNRPPNPPN